MSTEKRDWRILKYEKHGRFINWLLGKKHYPIVSFKRISDEVVFSVGDKIEYCGVFEWNTCHIVKIEIVNLAGSNELRVVGDNNANPDLAGPWFWINPGMYNEYRAIKKLT